VAEEDATGVRHWNALAIGRLNAVIYAANPLLTLKFRRRVGYWPNIADPSRYHEKMYWRKAFDRNPLFGVFCDKLRTKQYIRERLPAIRIPETLWTGAEIDESVYALLMPRSILKSNCGSGQVLFPHEHARGYGFTRRTAWWWMLSRHGFKTYEPAYRQARRCLLIEEFHPAENSDPVDFYIRAADGKVLQVSLLTNNKREGKLVAYFDENGQRLKRMEDGSAFWLPPDYRPPETFSAAMDAARTLSRGVDYARFDFFSVDGELFAGEITVYPNAGLTRAGDDPATNIDTLTNLHWNLRKSHFMTMPQTGRLGRYQALLERQWGDRP